MATRSQENTADRPKNRGLAMIRGAGVYYTAVVGAGFASGQEIMQFFSNFGTVSLLALIPVTLLFGYFGYVYMNMAHALNVNSHGPIIQKVCGKHIGVLFDWFVTFFLIGGFGLMISGGGTVLNEYFGMHPIAGRVLMAVVCVVVVNSGFQVIAAFNGYIGPVLIISLVVLSLIALAQDAAPIAQADAILQTATVFKGAPHILVSLCIYVGYCVVPNIAVIAAVGQAEPHQRTRSATGWMGGIALGISLIVINYVLLANYASIYEHAIPLLELIVRIYQPLGVYFAIILILGIVTTAVAGLFGSVSRLTTYGTSRAKLCSVIVGVIALLIGLVPFGQLMNILYPILGYVCVVVLAATVVYHIRHKNLSAATQA